MSLYFRKVGSGPPFLILHGLFGSGDNWQTHAKTLSEHFTVYMIDQRNHGHSFHSNEMNYQLMAEDLLNLVAEEGLRDLTLLGHSMGGKTVMHFAQENEFLIEKLIVVDMGIKGYPPHHDRIFEGLFNVKVEEVSSRKEAEERLAPYIEEPATLAFLMKNLYWVEPGKLGWRFNLHALHQHISEIIGPLKGEGKISIPSLFLKGENSHYINPADYDTILQRFPQGEIRMINGAGHWPHAEQPTQFMDEIKRFIL